MDLVYVVGRPALCDFNEIKYSIRSAEKNLKFDRLFLVGYVPKFIFKKSIYNLEIGDYCENKYKNVAKKVAGIMDSKAISEDFIYMNDDFFLLDKFKKVPYYHMGKIADWVEHYPKAKLKYYENICKLHKDFPDGLFFETHFPIVYNKEKAKKVIAKYKLKITIMLRSYYCNEYIDELDGVEKTFDYKIYNERDFEIITSNSPSFLSCTNGSGRLDKFRKYIDGKFPEKSRFEL